MKNRRITRRAAIDLFMCIENIRSGKLSMESLEKYIQLRIRLRELHEQFDKTRNEIKEQTKPEKWLDGDSTKEWNAKFVPLMNKWLMVEIEVDTRVFSKDECMDLIASEPDIRGAAIDYILKYMTE